MARPQSSPILGQLRNAKTLPEQTAALRALKNEVVGHIQKKEEWISLGVLDPIVRAISTHNAPDKQNGKDDDDALPLSDRALTEEEDLKLQALQLIASFAAGGPAFLPSIDAAEALPIILTNISPASNPRSIVSAALKCLKNISDAAILAAPGCPLDLPSLAEAIFTPPHIDSMRTLLASSQTNIVTKAQNELVIGLICRLCREDRHQYALANGGILDLLSMRLASFAVRDGYVVPGAQELASTNGLIEVFPAAAPASAKMGEILEAIHIVLGDSKYRAARLINSPAILAVFPPIRANQLPIVPGGGGSRELDFTGARLARPKWLTAMEYILPAVPVIQTKTSSAIHSPFSTPERTGTHTPSRGGAGGGKQNTVTTMETLRYSSKGTSNLHSAGDVESPLIPWLVHIVRSLDGYDRLMAASVLATLFRAGLGTMLLRETSLGLLVVPILVGMIAKYDVDGLEYEGSALKLQQMVLERAPAVLAKLITDCEYLQKAAFECDAVKILTKLLKHAYQPVSASDQPEYWSPHPDATMEVEPSAPISQLGNKGLNLELVHRIRVRESVLKAIGSLCAVKEEYRKALVMEDFVPYVVESLAKFPGKAKPPRDRSKEENATIEVAAVSPDPEYGMNPLSVIIAACYVVRMMSRSVSVLRTSLVDYSIAMPVFQFMRHPDINVQIAATATIINLVVEVSPVRELLTQNGLMKVLCEHAHSDNPALRLNALWALKHFVHAVGPELKKACLEQLEPGWLVQLIRDDDEEDSDIYSAGARISSTDDVDEDMETAGLEGPLKWLYAVNGSVRELDASRSSKLRQVEDYFAAIRESELNPLRRARNDDIAIQEQGLDFIRNLIGCPMSSQSSDAPGETTEVIDYLFSTLGQDRLFEILASKLKAKVIHPFSRRVASTTGGGGQTKIVHPRPRIVVAVICILVHIAASVPRHRQLVISQTELLKLLAQQSSNKDREVRDALCHLIINLTWKDDDSEAQACAQRAHELKKLGFHTKMETLKHQDRDLDVRERAKTAAWQIEQATY